LCDVYHWHIFHPLGESVNRDEQESETPWCPGQDAHDVDSPYYKESREINKPKRICMLRCLLLEELAVLAFGDDVHHVILGCRPVEIMPEGLANDRVT
jgi:hypothetical protein